MDMRSVMLSAEEVEDMREGFAKFAGRHEESWNWWQIIGGPLDGMSWPDIPGEMYSVGWCIPTLRGCVQAFYEVGGDGAIRFREQLLMG